MRLHIRNKISLFLLTFLLVQVFVANGQSNLLFYQTEKQFNSPEYNPAYLTAQQKFTFSIFPLAGMNVGYNNQSLINKMINNVLRGDTSKQVYKDVFNGLVKKGLFYQKFESNLFTFGYNSTKYGSFNFRIREIEQFQNDFKGDLTDFLIRPGSQTVYVDQPQTLPAQLLHYREYSLGYAREIIKNKLTVGVRAKLYFGKSSFVSDMYATTTIQDDTFHIRTAGRMNISAPVNVVLKDHVLQPFVLNDNFSAGKYMLNAKNIGTGIDFGFVFKINNRTEISGSVIDLGKINWKNNLNTLNFKGDYVFKAEDIQDATGVSLTKNPNFTYDSENNYDLFKVDSTTHQTFSTSLPTTINLGMKYRLNPRLNIGFVDRFTYLKRMNQNNFALLADYDLNKKLKISTGYSAIGNSLFNIPFGLLYQWEGGQTYIGSDNVFSLIFPSASDFSGITFGTCFYLFREKPKYKRVEYLPFYKQKKSRRVGNDGLQR